MDKALQVLFYISIILTVVSLVISIFTVLLYAKIRKFSDNPYNLMISSLIICEAIQSIHILMAIIFNDVQYEIVCQIDGVIAFFTYNAGAMYYWSLSHLILRLDFQKNSAAITTQFYHIVSVAYGAISSIFALACGDIEPSVRISIDFNDQPIGTCAIEAGSFSDLFPIVVMFLIFPYSIFTLLKVLINRKRGLKSIFVIVHYDQVVQFNVHLFNVIAFFVGWMPITFAHVYTYLAQSYPSDIVTKICFLFYCASGMLNSLLRLPADPSLRKAAVNVLCCRKKDSRSLSIISRKQSSMHFLRLNGKSLGIGEPFLSGKVQEPLDDFTQKSQIRIYTHNVITLSGAFLIIQDTYQAAEENSQLKRVIDYATVDERMVVQRKTKHFNIKEAMKDDKLVQVGNSTLPKISSKIVCRVKEYSPLVFHKIRLMYGITVQDLEEALLPSNNQKTLEKGYEKTSAKGGQSILKTQNKALLIKNLKKSQKNLLIGKLIERLYSYFEQNCNSLMVRFFGVFKIDSPIVKRQFVLLMENLDKLSDKLILFKYDLKFSQANRQVLPDQDVLQFIRHKALISNSLPELINTQRSSFQYLLNISHRESCDKSLISVNNLNSKSKSAAVISPRLSSSFNPPSISKIVSKKSMKSVERAPVNRLLSAFRKSSNTSIGAGIFEGHVDQSKIIKFNRLTELKDTDFKNVHGTLPVCSEDQGKLIAIIRQIKRDADFLRRNSIMDYSLLIIVVKTPCISQPSIKSHQDTKQKQKAAKNYEYIEQLDDLLSKYYAILRSPSKSFTYILGIIDYLQLWNIQKQGQKGIKEYLNPEQRGQQSAIPPRQYCLRFQSGINDIFEVVQDDPVAEQGSVNHVAANSDQNRSISVFSNKFVASTTSSNNGKLISGQLEMKNI